MSKQAGTTKNISTTGMPASQQPYLDKMLSEAERLYTGYWPTYYPGNTVAPFAEAERTARNYLSGYASNIAAPAAERTQQSLERVTGGDYLDVANNPVVKNMVRSSTDDVTQQLIRQAFPAIRSGAQLAGQFGGSRQGIAEGTAIGDAARAAQTTAAGINLGAYDKGLSSLMQGLQMAPSIQQMGYAPAEMLQAVGGQERAMAQAKINEEIARWQYSQGIPYTKLAEYANIVRSPTGGTSETYTTYPQTSGAQQIAGGVMTMLPTILNILKSFRIF